MNNLIRFCINNKYLLLVFAHLLLGVLLYLDPGIGKFYSLLVFIVCGSSIVIHRNNNHQALFAAAYVTGNEVLLRMVQGASHEFAKYTVVIFSVLGIYYSGFSRKSWLYLVYLLLLVPSFLLMNDLAHLTKKEVALLIMTLSGPVCLAFLSFYAFGKQISFAQASRMLLFAALPVLAIGTNVFLHSPDIKLIGSVASNPYFSGFFGPNQVATALGMGMCLFFIRAILNAETRVLFVTNLLLGSFLAYVGLVTFSRGGIITGFCTVVVTALYVFFKSKDYGKSKAKTGLIAFLVCFFSVFTLISYQTDNLLLKRYTNRTKLGEVKKDKPADRGAIATKEVKLFIKNPVLGVGTTVAEKMRMNGDQKINSHNEITRMLAEHGLFGFIGVIILFATPGWCFFKWKNVLLPTFFVFWFFSINHSCMRLVMPAFFYALMLLQVDLSHTDFFSRKLKSADPI